MTSIAAELLLLAHDDRTGKPLIDSTKLSASLAGAAIIDSVAAGQLAIDDVEAKPEKRRLRASGQDGDPALAEIVQYSDGKRAKDAVAGLAGVTSFRNRTKGLKDALLQDLVDAGVLQQDEGRVAGIFPATRWTERDGSVEAEIVSRVRAAVVEGQAPDARTAALVSLLHSTGLLTKTLPDVDKSLVKQAGKAIADGDWAAKSVKIAVDTVNAVLISTAVTGASVAFTA